MVTVPLAAHADGIALGRLPAEVVEKAKLCVLDAIGCGLAGASHGAIASLLEAVGPQPVDDGAAGASVWRAGLRTGAPTAALVNASMAHVVNADDAHKESMGHPGTVVIPAALAVGEMEAASGAALLEAVVAGYECLLRVGIGVGVASHRDRGGSGRSPRTARSRTSSMPAGRPSPASSRRSWSAPGCPGPATCSKPRTAAFSPPCPTGATRIASWPIWAGAS